MAFYEGMDLSGAPTLTSANLTSDFPSSRPTTITYHQFSCTNYIFYYCRWFRHVAQHLSHFRLYRTKCRMPFVLNRSNLDLYPMYPKFQPLLVLARYHAQLNNQESRLFSFFSPPSLSISTYILSRDVVSCQIFDLGRNFHFSGFGGIWGAPPS